MPPPPPIPRPNRRWTSLSINCRTATTTRSPFCKAEQAYQQAHIALLQAEASRYADTAALFQALGGGWWHRTDLGEADATIRFC